MPKLILETPEIKMYKTCYRDSTVELMVLIGKIPEDNETMIQVFKQMDGIFEQMILDKRKYYTVYDLSNMSCSMSHSLVLSAVEFFKTIREKLAVSCICSIVIFESMVVHTAVSLILKLYAPVKPVHFCTAKDEVPRLVSQYRQTV